MVECMSNSLSIPIHSRNNIIQYIYIKTKSRSGPKRSTTQYLIPSDRSKTQQKQVSDTIDHSEWSIHNTRSTPSPPSPSLPSLLSLSLSLSFYLSLSLSFYRPLSISLALSFSLSLSFSLPRTPPFRTPPRNKDVSNRAFETHSTHLRCFEPRVRHILHILDVSNARFDTFLLRGGKNEV